MCNKKERQKSHRALTGEERAGREVGVGVRVGVIKTCEYLREHCSEKLKITSTGPVYRSGLLDIYTS